MNVNKWEYLSPSKIGSARRISIPKEVFEKNILPKPDDSRPAAAWWAYEKTTGVIVLSDGPLEDKSFNLIGNRKIGGESDNYRVTVPKPFFSDSNSENTRSAAQTVPEIAQLNPHTELHFIAHREMMNTTPSSVYLLSVEKLEGMIGNDTEIQSIADKTPR